MADGRLTPLGADARGVWPRILAVYAAGRVVTTAIMLLSAAIAPANGRHGSSASPLDYAVGWDGAWYREIALFGYPEVLPRDGDGAVQQNAWAFMPLYPLLARAFAALVPGAGVGADDVWAVAHAWAGCAVAISLIAGLAACRLLYALLEPRIGDRHAMTAVALLSFGPLAAMFQVAYAEALFLALLLGGLVCLDRRSWWPLYLVVPAMAATRPGVLAFALAVAILGLARLAQRRADPIRRAEVVHILSIGAIGTASGFAWPVVAAQATGEQDAYFQTELAWRSTWVPDAGGFIPGEGWLQAASVWSEIWGVPSWAGYALLAVIAACAVGMLLLPNVRRLGIVPRAWAAAYLVYLALVFFPQSSTLRLLLPLAPLFGALALRLERTRARAIALSACIAAQAAWIVGMYGYGNTFWLVP